MGATVHKVQYVVRDNQKFACDVAIDVAIMELAKNSETTEAQILIATHELLSEISKLLEQVNQSKNVRV